MIGDIMDGAIDITVVHSNLMSIKATWITRLLTSNQIVKAIYK